MTHLTRHSVFLPWAIAAGSLLLAAPSRAAQQPEAIAGPSARDAGNEPSLTVIPADGQDPWTVPQLSSALSVTVSGPLARAQLLQVFDNPSEETVDAVYHFPLAPATVVTGLFMTVGDYHFEGRLQREGEAKTHYTDAREALHTAGLLQTSESGVSLRVANLGPGQTVELSIHYLQEVAVDGPWRSVHFPVTRAPSDQLSRDTILAAGAEAGPWLQAEIDFEARDKVFNIHSPTHELDSFARHDGSTATRLRYGPLIADRHLIVRWQQPETTESPMLFEQLSSGERFALWQRGQSPTGPQVAREVVFVVDSTASMYGEALVQARHALRQGLSQLSAQDTFNVVVLNDKARSLFDKPVPADTAHLQTARAMSNQFSARGSGPLLAALQLANENSPAAAATSEHPLDQRRAVVLLSDGESMHSAEVMRHINTHRLDQPLFSVGLGSSPNLDAGVAAARLGNGAFFHSATVRGADPALPSLFAKLGTASLSEGQLHFEGAPQTQAFPDALPTLWSGDRPTVVAQLSAESMAVALRGRLANGQWVRTVQDTSKGRHFEGLHRVWAGRKLQFAQDEQLRSEKNCDAQCKKALGSLALRHGILSPQTSWFVATQAPSVRAAGKAVLVPLAPAAGSSVSSPEATNDPGEPTCQWSPDPSSPSLR